MIKTLLYIIATFLTVVSLMGCQTSAVEEDFGNSVRQMIAEQKAHPDVSANPDPNPVDGTDATRVEAALRTYREDPTLPDSDTQAPIVDLQNEIRN